jgi:hypothetical protein
MYEYIVKGQMEIQEEFLEGFGRYYYIHMFKMAVIYLLESNTKLVLIIY